MKNAMRFLTHITWCLVLFSSCTSTESFPTAEPMVLEDFLFETGTAIETGTIMYYNTAKKAVLPAETNEPDTIRIAGASKRKYGGDEVTWKAAPMSILLSRLMRVYDWSGTIHTQEESAPFSFRYYHNLPDGSGGWLPKHNKVAYETPPGCYTRSDIDWQCNRVKLVQRQEYGGEGSGLAPLVLYLAKAEWQEYTIQVVRMPHPDEGKIWRTPYLLSLDGQELQILDAADRVVAAIHSTDGQVRNAYTIYDGCPESRREDMRILIGMCCAELNEFCRRLRG